MGLLCTFDPHLFIYLFIKGDYCKRGCPVREGWDAVCWRQHHHVDLRARNSYSLIRQRKQMLPAGRPPWWQQCGNILVLTPVWEGKRVALHLFSRSMWSALLVIHLSFSRSVRDRVRSKMERDILAEVNHPFIVKLHYGESDQQCTGTGLEQDSSCR